MWKFYQLCFLMFLLAEAESRSQDCKKPFVSLHRACYKFVKEMKSWTEAQRLCSEEGATLVSIGSMAEKGQIVKQLHKIITHMKHASWWVGLKLNKTIAKWKWQEGTDLNLRVTKWAPGEPNNALNGEHCAELSFRGTINDGNCSFERPYVCELIKITQPPTSSTVATRLTTTGQPTTVTMTMTSTTSSTPQPTTTEKPITTTQNTTPQTTTSNKITSTTKAVGYTTTQYTTPETTTNDTTTSATKAAEYTTTQTTKKYNKTTRNYLSGFPVDGNIHHFKTTRSTTVKPTIETTTMKIKIPSRRPDATPKPNTRCPLVNAYGTVWPRAVKGETVSQKCKETEGYATWTCGGYPVHWLGEPNVSECASASFKEIVSMSTSIAGNKSSLTPEVAEDITKIIVEKTETSNTMSAADIAVSTNLLKITSKVKPKDSKQAKKLVQDFVSAGNNLIEQTKHSLAIKPFDKSRAASRLLSTMELATSNMVDVINEPTIFQTRTDKISLTLHVLNTTNENLIYDDSGTDNTFKIPSSVLKSFNKDGLTKVVFMTHFDVGDLLSGKENTGNTDNYKTEVASDVISASFGKEKAIHLTEPVTFSMKMTKSVEYGTIPVCSFWNFSIGQIGDWSQVGCERQDYNATHTTCQCDHLTNFAILLDVSGVDVAYHHTRILDYITYIGCIISILSLSTAWLTFQCLSTLQGERNSIHKNLVFCLFAAELIFVVGISRTEQKVACAAIALLLHFFFLSAFTWMFMEGIHIIFMLVQVFDKAKSKMKYYYLCGYGAPIIIVAVTATIDFKAYGTADHCWLTTENWFIWSFAGPVALILVMNAGVLAYSLTMVCKHSDYVFSRERAESSNFRAWIQGAMAIEVLLGLTWVFGYFFVSNETVVMAYIFTILNSLQGLFIFVFHCVLNKKVRKEYKKLVRLSKKAQTSTKQSSLKKQSGSYELYVPSS